jgi:hypothetical protein
MRRLPVGWLVFGVTVGVWALGFFGYVSLVVAVVVTLFAAFFGAWYLDRTRRNKTVYVTDPNRPEFYAPLENVTWQVPTSYIDHRTGGGAPPGVERYDEQGVEKMLGDRDTGEAAQPSDDDEAP